MNTVQKSRGHSQSGKARDRCRNSSISGRTKSVAGWNQPTPSLQTHWAEAGVRKESESHQSETHTASNWDAYFTLETVAERVLEGSMSWVEAAHYAAAPGGDNPKQRQRYRSQFENMIGIPLERRSHGQYRKTGYDQRILCGE
jgi:hypothetical protein